MIVAMTAPAIARLASAPARTWVAPVVMAALLGLFLLASPLRLEGSWLVQMPDGSWTNSPDTPYLFGTSWLGSGYLVRFVTWVAGLSCVTAVLLARRRPVLATFLAAWPFVTIPLLGTFVWG